MERKINIVFNLLVVLALIAIGGCKSDMGLELQGKEDYVNLYIPKANKSPNLVSVFVNDSVQTTSFNVYLGGADDAKNDIRVSVDFMPEKAAAYNAEKSTNYPVMPPGSYELESKEAVIRTGQTGSSKINVKLKTLGYIDPFIPYLLPVSITGVSDDTAQNPTLSTVFFLVTGTYEAGKVPTEKVLQLEGGNQRSIFKYYNNLVTQSPEGEIRLYPYIAAEGKFGPGAIVPTTGWDKYNVVVPFLDRWIVRWGPVTNNGILNSYSVSPAGAISGPVAGWFSSGFQAFDLLIPYESSMLVRWPDGRLTRYPLNDNYVFSGGTQIGTGFNIFTQILPYKNNTSLLCIEANGNMWEYPLTAAGVFSPRKQVGSGWDTYRKVVPFGDDLLGIDENNAVFQYKFNPVGFWALK